MQRDNLHTNIKRGVTPVASPQCIGVIMDGNRRWAERNGRQVADGHAAGYEKLKAVITWAKAEAIPYLVVYGFSTENRGRTQPEIDMLMVLFRRFFTSMTSVARKNDVAISFIGLREHLPEDIQKAMHRLERETRACQSLHLVIAAPYGARAELLDTINRIKDTESSGEPVTEDIVNQYLWTADIPDPDMIIRTGGRRRLSNFLLWQAAYAELFFTDTLWPDFTQKEFTKILYEYSLRTRSYGT